MARFPAEVEILRDGFGMQDGPVVDRSEVERGVAKARRTSTDPKVAVNCTLLFRTAAIEKQFRAWLYSSDGGAGGAAWFDWFDPRAGVVRSARIVASSIGQVVPESGHFAVSKQSMSIEFVERL